MSSTKAGKIIFFANDNSFRQINTLIKDKGEQYQIVLDRIWCITGLALSHNS